jgi:hypothetical protein
MYFFVHDRRDPSVDPNDILGFLPTFAVTASFQRVHIEAHIFLVPQDLVDLGIFDLFSVPSVYAGLTNG